MTHEKKRGQAQSLLISEAQTIKDENLQPAPYMIVICTWRTLDAEVLVEFDLAPFANAMHSLSFYKCSMIDLIPEVMWLLSKFIVQTLSV